MTRVMARILPLASLVPAACRLLSCVLEQAKVPVSCMTHGASKNFPFPTESTCVLVSRQLCAAMTQGVVQLCAAVVLAPAETRGNFALRLQRGKTGYAPRG